MQDGPVIHKLGQQRLAFQCVLPRMCCVPFSQLISRFILARDNQNDQLLYGLQAGFARAFVVSGTYKKNVSRYVDGI